MTPPRSTHPAVILVLAILLWLTLSRARGAEDSMRVTLPLDISYESYLTRWEGYSLRAYLDRDGTYSVGIGHNLGTARPKRFVYTHAEVAAFFRLDLARALDCARANVEAFDELPPEVRLVVVSLIFGCGRSGFSQWHEFIKALNHRFYRIAATELRRSRWWRQVGIERATICWKVLNDVQ